MSIRIEKKVGTGSCADVWSAVDKLDRRVAVKILRSSAPYYSAALAHAKALARAQHNNVVTIYGMESVQDPDTKQQVDGIIMEFIDGCTLQQTLQQSDLFTLEQSYSISMGIVAGLEHIHSVGLVHNDLHSANIIIKNNEAKIIDILYTDSLMKLTIGTKEEKIRHDIRSLTTVLFDIAQHSIINRGPLKEYGLSLNDSMMTIDAIKKSLDRYFNVSRQLLVGIDNQISANEPFDAISDNLNERLNQALRSFSSQPSIWVDRVLCKPNQVSRNADQNADHSLDSSHLIANPRSTIISAPPQFGLTCLAHYLTKEAWIQTGSRWLYLDASTIKPHAVEKAVKRELESLRLSMASIKCVVLDSWTNYEKSSLKLLKSLSDLFRNVPIIVMQTIDDLKFLEAPTEDTVEPIDRDFEVLHLLALPRRHIRSVISAYNNKQHIGDEDAILTKIVSDLEMLNIHRTPLNCITLLKISEKYFDESPVNRTKLLEMVLNLLFNTDGLPTYKIRPDMKDCEYVLGRFCETMIRNGIYTFSRQDFLKELGGFCSEKLIDLEIDVVFDTLFLNNIIIKRDISYAFRFSYWVHYFAAQRMHSDAEFAKYIFDDERYISYPEIVEFYTGIDRSRENALQILLRDIRLSCETVRSRVNLPDGMNPYSSLQWQSTEEEIAQMKEKISEDVLKSNLPIAVKDRYADRMYDQSRPYDQTIRQIFHKFSLVILMQNIKAASRALRNSDYVSPEIKRELLNEIMRAWEQLAKVVLAIAPLLASRGHALFEGVDFILDAEAGESVEQRLVSVLYSVPFIVANTFKDNLSSPKIGPLLFDYIKNEHNPLKKHQMILMVAMERPREWKKNIEDYIVSLPSNSYYLHNLLNILSMQYQFSFASGGTLTELEYLIKMILSKHQTGSRKPGLHEISRLPHSLLPKRDDKQN